MAEIKRTMLGRNMEAWINFANSLFCDLVTVDDEGYICISDVYKFKIASNGDLELWENDIQVSVALQPVVDYGGSTVTAVYNPNFIFISAKDSTRYGNFMLFYEVVGGMHLFKNRVNLDSTGSSVSPVVPVIFDSLGPITDKETLYQYTHNARLNFKTEPGTILYTSDVLFQNNVKITIDPNFLACTEVPIDQLVVFNMHEFYSLGSHIVVPIGFEPEEESGKGDNT